jgi:polysaccharide biosynthesis/export protein
MRRLLAFSLLAISAASPALWASQKEPSGSPAPATSAPLAAAAPQAPSDYQIGPKDLLDIKVFEIPDLNGERRVTDAGMISLPLLGDLPVSGLTTTQISDRLNSMLTAKYVNRANVSVIVKEFASKPVSIVGSVFHPGSLVVSGYWTLLQAISAAGGLTESAGRKIYILRRSDNGLSDTLEVKVDDLFRASASQWNITLAPGDVVNVPARRTVRVFCLGEVKSPGALEFDSDDRITLLAVIAKAGGLTDRASHSIRIKRRGPDGKDTEQIANFNRIVSGKESDPVLRGDDVVVAKESFF